MNIQLDYSGASFLACSIVTLAGNQISVEYSSGSRGGGVECESFPAFYYSYEVEGNMKELFGNFASNTEASLGNEDYRLMVDDGSAQDRTTSLTGTGH